MLLVDLLKEYKYGMQIRNYSQRTIKTCFNYSLKFINYCKIEFGELEDFLPMYKKDDSCSMQKSSPNKSRKYKF